MKFISYLFFQGSLQHDFAKLHQSHITNKSKPLKLPFYNSGSLFHNLSWGQNTTRQPWAMAYKILMGPPDYRATFLVISLWRQPHLCLGTIVQIGYNQMLSQEICNSNNYVTAQEQLNIFCKQYWKLLHTEQHPNPQLIFWHELNQVGPTVHSTRHLAAASFTLQAKFPLRVSVLLLALQWRPDREVFDIDKEVWGKSAPLYLWYLLLFWYNTTQKMKNNNLRN